MFKILLYIKINYNLSDLYQDVKYEWNCYILTNDYETINENIGVKGATKRNFDRK